MKDAEEVKQAAGGTHPAIRDAATVVLLRRGPAGPSVLMGQRGAAAAFMPSKFVFPGGAVDPLDARIDFAAPLGAECARRLGPAGPALAAAAIRELWEEAGLRLAASAAPPAGELPQGWGGFGTTGLAPDASSLRFLFRAITPPGRPRRFDARFFLAPAEALIGDPDDFAAADSELSHLSWVPLATAQRLDLPFITSVVLAEVAAFEASGESQPRSVPFFDNSARESRFRRIR